MPENTGKYVKNLPTNAFYPSNDQKRCIQKMQKSLDIGFLFLADSVGNNTTLPPKVWKEGMHGDLPLSYCDIQSSSIALEKD